jgi:hypothetical protein
MQNRCAMIFLPQSTQITQRNVFSDTDLHGFFAATWVGDNFINSTNLTSDEYFHLTVVPGLKPVVFL